METLVRRILRKWKTPRKMIYKADERDVRRMERLEEALAAWVAAKGWRRPVRTVTEAAEQLGTDSVLLYHYFQERLHTDFRTWRTRLRLEEAERLLVEEPATPASEIARRVGFSNRSNFARQFLAYTGMTPGAWRVKAQEAGTSHDVPAPKRL